MTFKIPADFSCAACTLQFWYRTGNSCTPDEEAYHCYYKAMADAGWTVKEFLKPGGYYPLESSQQVANPRKCPAVKTSDSYARANNCGEQFKNCADVIVLPSGPTPPPTPMPPTPPPTPAPPTPEPEPSSEPATSGGATTGGAATTSVDGNCVDGDVSWKYPNHPCSEWDLPAHCVNPILRDACCGCGAGGATGATGGTATATTEPEPASEPSSEPDPTSEPASTPASTPSATSAPCDDGSAGACKAQCSAACGNSVATNQ